MLTGIPWFRRRGVESPASTVFEWDRVTSRWVLTGTNNGILGTEPNGKPVAMTGTAVWSVAGGKLQRGWVEQASFELYHWLLAN